MRSAACLLLMFLLLPMRLRLLAQPLSGHIFLDETTRAMQDDMDRFPLNPGHAGLIAPETFVRHRARGEKVDVQTDGEMAPSSPPARRYTTPISVSSTWPAGIATCSTRARCCVANG